MAYYLLLGTWESNMGKEYAISAIEGRFDPFEKVLTPGEHVLWRGKPEKGPFVFRTWPLTVYGGLLLATVIVYWWTILTTEAPDDLAFWGIPFGIAALYMAVGHFVLTTHEWHNTEYIVTDARVLIMHGAITPKMAIYSLAGLPHTIVEMHGQDVGNIMFKPQQGQGYGPWPGYQNMWPYTPGYLLGIMYILNPEEIQQLIEEARRA